MRTANPALSDKVFQGHMTADRPMTIQGTVNKSFFLIAIVIATAALTWNQLFPRGLDAATPPSIGFGYYGCILLGLGIAIAIIFKKTWAPYLAWAYAAVEGVILGTLSALFELRYPGIVPQAMFGTLGVFLSLLLVYKSGLIKVTENFKLGVVAATGGILILYLINFVMSFWGNSIPVIHSSSNWGIAFSLFVIGVAALNLVLDFDFIEKGAARGAPRYLEWYAAFGLLVTLIWLYIEILRLLAKARNR